MKHKKPGKINTKVLERKKIIIVCVIFVNDWGSGFLSGLGSSSTEGGPTKYTVNWLQTVQFAIRPRAKLQVFRTRSQPSLLH